MQFLFFSVLFRACCVLPWYFFVWFRRSWHCLGLTVQCTNIKVAWVWEWQSHGESGYQKYLLQISTAVNLILRDRKHHDCRWYRFPGDIDSRSRLKTAVCNGRFLSCAISRCYPQNLKRFEGAFNATQHGSTQVSRGARRHRESAVGACFCVKNWDEMHAIVLTMERHLIWTEFDSWILMKMNWNPACSDIFGQGQMPHLFWCWILQSCARPLIVDKGTALSAAPEWRQPHAKSFLVVLNHSTLQSLKSFEGVFIQCRQRQPTKPKFAQKRGTNPRSRRVTQGECHAYHAPFCNIANHCHMNES